MQQEIVGSLLAHDLTLNELKGALYVIEQTYGCESKWARLSISQWAAALRIDRRNVPRLVKNLVTKNLIERRDGSGSIPEYRFQWDCSLWKVCKRPVPKLPKWKERAHRVISKEDSGQKASSISTDDTEGQGLPQGDPPDAGGKKWERTICLFCKKPIDKPKRFQVLCEVCDRPRWM
jgi:hypothetical protein